MACRRHLLLLVRLLLLKGLRFGGEEVCVSEASNRGRRSQLARKGGDVELT